MSHEAYPFSPNGDGVSCHNTNMEIALLKSKGKREIVEIGPWFHFTRSGSIKSAKGKKGYPIQPASFIF